MTARVVFIDCNDQLRPVLDDVRREDDVAISVNQQSFSSTDLPTLLDGCAICIDDHSYMPTDIVAQCRDLRHVVFLGTGPQSYMDVEALHRLGVTVHPIKGYGDTAVAEHAVALMFAAARDVARMDRDIRGGTWRPRGGVQLKGKRLGVVGLGGIGAEVARIANGIGMEVVAWNRTLRTDPPYRLVTLEELLASSDVVSLHLALSDETRGFLDRARLSMMKGGAILINTARGALVDEAALVEALNDGHLASAGLDVFALEPLRVNHPLAKLDRVTLSAHAGFRTYEASATLLRRALDIARRLVARDRSCD
ncbi:MAG: 3-phosphoglycerate dehydrogenase [Methylobacteriaceae bacterium]|nr:3-phosphoglycerate dehydrogenase [Methylobacteriaceae bacterium]